MAEFDEAKSKEIAAEDAIRPNPGTVEIDRGNEADISPPRGHSFPIVGIGGSAGSLDAFTKLLQVLPADTDMAFVFVQHLDPHHPSHLSEILGKATAMPVRNVEDGMAVRPNEVFVIPPNATMMLEDGVLRLAPRNPGLHLPIDAFFESVARVQGSRAIGIILSGNASDGSQGVRAIKGECGLTFAQDEASAQHVGMPRNSVATGAIDYVLAPAEIARELTSLSQHPYVRTPQPDRAEAELLPDGDGELRKIFHILKSRTKVDFSHYKPNTIRRRIGRRMIVNRTRTLHDYTQLIEKQPEEAGELYRDLLISVTNFFRDPEAFEALHALLKDILLARTGSEAFRVWVPGCATGEEVYSIAICLRELTDELKLNTAIQFFGTDISELALERARAGVYPEIIAQDVSAERLRKFFIRVDRGYLVSKVIREACVFARQDVTNDPPFGHMDMVSCRNLLIYLDSVLQRKVLPIFHYSLNPTGLLLLGSAESIAAASDLFSVMDKQHRIYGRKAAPVRLTLNLAAGPTNTGDPDIVKIRITSSGLDLQKKADLVIQSKYAPPAVVIDTDMTILHFRGRTGFYLEAPSGEARFDLLRMARNGLVMPLRRAIDAAANQNISIRESGVSVEYLGERREVTIEVTPIPGSAPGERYFVVVFQEDSSGVSAAVADGAEVGERTEDLSSLEVQNRELLKLVAEMRDQIRNASEDHEAHTEELRAANEEVRSANEELQSTNEELSTTKEELQSANEELTTLNEELQNRNGELNTVNSDLGNLLSAVDIPFLMVDNDLRLRRFSAAAEALMGVKTIDLGHPPNHFQGRLDLTQFQPVMRKVIETLEPEQHEVQDSSGHWFSVKLRPYRTLDDRIAGAVIVFVDIDPLKRTLRAAEEARDYAEGLVETVREPLVVLDSDLRIQRATSAFYDQFRVSRAETEGRLLYDLGSGQWNVPRLRELLGNALFRNESFQDLEIEHTFPHVGRRRMRLNGRRISPDGDAQRSVLLAIEDISERREHAEIRYQRLFETARDAMLIFDGEVRHLTDVNPYFVELTGYTREQLIGRRMDEMEAFKALKDSADFVQQAREHVTRRDGLELRRVDGAYIIVDLVANRYTVGGQDVVQINIRDVTARARVFEELRGSEERFRLFVESVLDYALFQTDPRGLISSWNSGAQRLLGFTSEEILGQPIDRIFTPEDKALGKPALELETARSQGSSEDERWHLRKDGTRFFASGVLTTVRDAEGTLRGFAKVMRDVTEWKHTEEQIQTSLREKEVLLKEIHHRVKNNLQIISSLLDLQAEFLSEKNPEAILVEMNTRVRSIAAIHEMLYSATDLSSIDFANYLQNLAKDVSAVYSERSGKVRIVVDAKPVPLEITKAVPCGLMVNELLTNGLKHAFPGNQTGLITVSFQCSGTSCTLKVADDGIGFPELINPQNAKSMGFQLLNLLMEQVKGTMQVDRSSGTEVTISFPHHLNELVSSE